MLICVECGCCSDELAKGWAAYQGTDPDGIEPDDVSVYCPVCAAQHFGFRPELAETYVCVWEPFGQAGETP